MEKGKEKGERGEIYRNENTRGEITLVTLSLLLDFVPGVNIQVSRKLSIDIINRAKREREKDSLSFVRFFFSRIPFLFLSLSITSVT